MREAVFAMSVSFGSERGNYYIRRGEVALMHAQRLEVLGMRAAPLGNRVE